MPGFVQIMEYDTSRIDEVDALVEEMQAERGDQLRVTRAVATQDRDHPNHYCSIVEFDSYDEAMANSNDPVTKEFAQRMGALVDGEPTFRNLDVRSLFTH